MAQGSGRPGEGRRRHPLRLRRAQPPRAGELRGARAIGLARQAAADPALHASRLGRASPHPCGPDLDDAGPGFIRGARRARSRSWRASRRSSALGRPFPTRYPSVSARSRPASTATSSPTATYWPHSRGATRSSRTSGSSSRATTTTTAPTATRSSTAPTTTAPASSACSRSPRPTPSPRRKDTGRSVRFCSSRSTPRSAGCSAHGRSSSARRCRWTGSWRCSTWT